MTKNLLIVCLALVFPCIAQDNLYKKTLKKNCLRQFPQEIVIKNFKSLPILLSTNNFYAQLDAEDNKKEFLNDAMDVLVKLNSGPLYIGTFKGLRGSLEFFDSDVDCGDNVDKQTFPLRVIYRGTDRGKTRLIAKIVETEKGFVFDAIDQRNWAFSGAKNRKYRTIYKNEKNFIKKITLR